MTKYGVNQNYLGYKLGTNINNIIPRGSLMTPWIKNSPEMQETQKIQVQSLGQKIPWSRKWQPTLVFLPEKAHGQRSLVGYIHRVAKSRT